jgi:protein transport protein SEC24
MMKHPFFHSGLAADERSFLISYISAMPCNISVVFVCPRLFEITTIPDWACIPNSEGRVFLPPTLYLSKESLNPAHLYLLDDSRYLYLWVSEAVKAEVMTEVFGVEKKDELADYKIARSSDPSRLSSRVTTLLDKLRSGKPYFQNLQTITRQSILSPPGAPAMPSQETLDEKNFVSRLIEDPDPKGKKGSDGEKETCSMSYVEFLCYIHKAIQKKFRPPY